MEARGKTINDWFAIVQQSLVLLPRFQRHEAWSHRQIEGLLENILREPSLPIGALLVLEVGDSELFHSRPIVGAPARAGRPLLHLLDGQQRMTALWRSLTADYDGLTLLVDFSQQPLDDGAVDLIDDAPDVRAEQRWVHKGTRRPIWVDDDAELFRKNLIPIACLCPGQKGETRLKAYREAVAKAGLDAYAYLDRFYALRQRVASYVIPFLALPVRTSKETALDVFIKMNTSASPLSDFDIVVAQLEEAMGESLHDKVAELQAAVPSLAAYGNVEDNVLAVAALLNGKAALKTTYLDKDFGRSLAEVWPRLIHGFRRGLDFLQREGIFGAKALPSEVAVYLTCALWADVPEHGFDQEGNARAVIRKALWRACCTNRYVKTATTRAHADYKVLALMIAGAANGAVPELFDEKLNPIPDESELISAGWPGRKDRLPRAILAASLRQGGLDFADGAPATPQNVMRREYHHIFPVAGFPDGTAENEFNRALNCALITWRTNRKLSASAPADYLRARTEAAALGENAIRARLATHLVPYDVMARGDYSAFLEERARIVREAIVALCDGHEPVIRQ